MIKRIPVILIAAVVALSGASQTTLRQQPVRPQPSKSSRIDIDIPGKRKTPKTRSNRSNQNTQRKARKGHKRVDSVPDTVYSHNIIKQHGWLAPLGIISKETASHTYASARFTRPNAKGHYQRMEMINGYGNYVSEGVFKPYVLSYVADSLAKEQWQKLCNQVCIIETLADPSGENVVQERSYSASGQLIFAFSRLETRTAQNGRKQIIGSYKDSIGMPVEMRYDPTGRFTYGTLVRITEDRWGNDSVIEFLDAKGIVKPNDNGVAKDINVYDSKGRRVRRESRDDSGKLVIDNWGNCGVETEWNDDHTGKSKTYYDENWQPMAMPSDRAGERKGVISSHYKYDNYYRVIEEAYFDAEDNPAVNAYGVHKMKHTFNSKGYVVEESYYDLRDSLKNSIYGGAHYLVEYDERGNRISCQAFDEQGEKTWYFNNQFNEAGEQIYGDNHIINDGVDICSYLYKKEGDTLYRLENDVIEITKFDNKNRIIDWSIYDKDKKPIMGTYGIHRRVSTYIDRPGFQEEIRKYFDTLGDLCTETPIGYYTTDSLANKFITKTCDRENRIVHYFVKYLSPEGEVIGQAGLNDFGIQCRTRNDGVLYYRADVETAKSISNGDKFSSFVGRDEFGEPDYIWTGYGIYYYSRLSSQSLNYNKFYDEHNEEITDVIALMNKLPKAMMIEVVDTAAYSLGLRDNDMILVYGDYSVQWDEEQGYYDFLGDWSLHSILEAGDTRRMVVFRIEDANAGKFGLVEIPGLKGTPEELGFITHSHFLTDRQLNRVTTCINADMTSANPLLKKEDFKNTNPESGGSMFDAIDDI